VKKTRCHRCNRRWRDGAADADRWNTEFKAGVVLWLLCPGCQTPEENLQAEINDATLNYARLGGIGVCWPKGGSAS